MGWVKPTWEMAVWRFCWSLAPKALSDTDFTGTCVLGDPENELDLCVLSIGFSDLPTNTTLMKYPNGYS